MTTISELGKLYCSEVNKFLAKNTAAVDNANCLTIVIEMFDYIIKNNIFLELKRVPVVSAMLEKLNEFEKEHEIFKKIKIDFLKSVPQDLLDQVPEDIYKPMFYFPTTSLVQKEKISKYFFVKRASTNKKDKNLIANMNEVVYNKEKKFFDLKDKVEIKGETKNVYVCMIENGKLYLPSSYWKNDDDDKESLSTELSLMFSSQNITIDQKVTILSELGFAEAIFKKINIVKQIKCTNKQDFDNVYNNTDICKDVCGMIFDYCGFYVTICIKLRFN